MTPIRLLTLFTVSLTLMPSLCEARTPKPSLDEDNPKASARVVESDPPQQPQTDNSQSKSTRDLWNRTAGSEDAASPDSTKSRFAAPVGWDVRSADTLPRFFVANGATAIMAMIGEVRCTIDVKATPSAGPPTNGTLAYAWNDANNDGILTADEVNVEITDGDHALLEPYRKQLEIQALCGTPRVLLRSSVKTEKQGDGYLVTITSGPQSDALESMGLTEIKCTLSPDLCVTEMNTKDAKGLASFAHLRSEKINGLWFVTQSIRRIGVPGSGIFQEKTDFAYAKVDGQAVQKRMLIDTEALAPNGETTATIQQEFIFRDWKLVNRTQPLDPPVPPRAKTEVVVQKQIPAPVRVEKRRTTSARRTQTPEHLATDRQLPIDGMEKYVSPQARFALYKPKGWRVSDAAEDGFLAIAVTDPTAEYTAQMIYGPNPDGANPLSIARGFVQNAGRRQSDLRLASAFQSTDGKSIVFDSLVTDPARGKTKCRNWVSVGRDTFTFTRCEAPADRFEQSRRVLLTILMNIRIMQNTIADAPRVLPLSQFRLSDGSASFSLPQGWTLERDLGVGHFSARDPSGLCSFSVASIEVITPQLGVRVPGVPVLPYLSPHQALASLADFQGILRDVRFVEVIPRSDIASMIAQVYTVGPVQAEEGVSTYLLNGTRCKGYTFGVSLGSRLETNWRFNHMSVGAPAAEFNSLLPTFVAMMASYRISDEFAMQYIAQGLAHLRQMQQETAAIIAKNRHEISAMMQAAYDERQRSQDWIDYQRTNYILGRTDWISSMEGGAVYHTDSWGTQNNVTGERWDGFPFNYVNFEGQNPKYNELMTPINDRRLFEQVYRNQ